MTRTLATILVTMLAGVPFYPDCASAHNCVGDCDASDTVIVSEMVRGVQIALGAVDIGTCEAFDADDDGGVSIDELLVAVNNVFSYCGHGEPPTPVPTSTPAAAIAPQPGNGL